MFVKINVVQKEVANLLHFTKFVQKKRWLSGEGGRTVNETNNLSVIEIHASQEWQKRSEFIEESLKLIDKVKNHRPDVKIHIEADLD